MSQGDESRVIKAFLRKEKLFMEFLEQSWHLLLVTLSVMPQEIPRPTKFVQVINSLKGLTHFIKRNIVVPLIQDMDAGAICQRLVNISFDLTKSYECFLIYVDDILVDDEINKFLKQKYKPMNQYAKDNFESELYHRIDQLKMFGNCIRQEVPDGKQYSFHVLITRPAQHCDFYSDFLVDLAKVVRPPMLDKAIAAIDDFNSEINFFQRHFTSKYMGLHDILFFLPLGRLEYNTPVYLRRSGISGTKYQKGTAFVFDISIIIHHQVPKVCCRKRPVDPEKFKPDQTILLDRTTIKYRPTCRTTKHVQCFEIWVQGDAAASGQEVRSIYHIKVPVRKDQNEQLFKVLTGKNIPKIEAKKKWFLRLRSKEGSGRRSGNIGRTAAAAGTAAATTLPQGTQASSTAPTSAGVGTTTTAAATDGSTATPGDGTDTATAPNNGTAADNAGETAPEGNTAGYSGGATSGGTAPATVSGGLATHDSLFDIEDLDTTIGITAEILAPPAAAAADNVPENSNGAITVIDLDRMLSY